MMKIHPCRVDFPHKEPVMRQTFPCRDVVFYHCYRLYRNLTNVMHLVSFPCIAITSVFSQICKMLMYVQDLIIGASVFGSLSDAKQSMILIEEIIWGSAVTKNPCLNPVICLACQRDIDILVKYILKTVHEYRYWKVSLSLTVKL